jgi:hypothetical protein
MNITELLEWKDEARRVRKNLYEFQARKEIKIVEYISKEFSSVQLREAKECQRKQKGVMSKLKSPNGSLEGYLVQWEEKKEKKKHREFNYKQLKRKLDEKKI